MVDRPGVLPLMARLVPPRLPSNGPCLQVDVRPLEMQDGVHPRALMTGDPHSDPRAPLVRPVRRERRGQTLPLLDGVLRWRHVALVLRPLEAIPGEAVADEMLSPLGPAVHRLDKADCPLNVAYRDGPAPEGVA